MKKLGLFTVLFIAYCSVDTTPNDTSNVIDDAEVLLIDELASSISKNDSDINVEEITLVEDPDSPISTCNSDFVYYPIEYSTVGVYVANDGDAYHVSMHFEDMDDAFRDNVYTIKDFGRAAHAVFEAWEEQGLNNPQEVRTYLSRFHIIVLHEKENEDKDPDFARLYHPVLFAENPYLAIEKAKNTLAYVYWSGSTCFPDVPKEANFFVVFRQYNLLLDDLDSVNNTPYLRTIIHELLHPACLVGLGDPQRNHDDERIWDTLGYMYNIQDIAKAKFLVDY